MNSEKAISNSIINLSTQIIPVFVALIFIPISIKLLGSELFGIYTLIVTFIVLFNYLNFGIAPATTKEIARFLAVDNQQKVISLLINSFFIMFSIGLLLSIVFLLFHHEIANIITKKETLKVISSNILFLFTFLSPLLMSVIFLRSALEAKQNFLVTSLNRAFLNSMIFISPVIVYIDGFDIVSVFKFIVIIYFISIMVLGLIVYKEYFNDTEITYSFKDSKSLFQIGFWMMLSSIAGIGLYYADRFIISATISALAVAYYVAAYDLITRLNIISGSITSALFPAFSHWYETDEKDNINRAISFTTKVVLFLVSIVGIVIIVYSKGLLGFWINSEYAINSYSTLQILTIGVLFNTLSIIPFRTLSAIGFQKIAAMVYVIETPFTLIWTYLLIKYYGIQGAAVSYTLRAFLEMLIFYYLISKGNINLNLSFNLIQIAKISFIYILFFVCAFLIFLYLTDYYKIFALATVLLLICIFQYFIVFNKDEKNKIFQTISKIKAKM